jgi:hypothetical protein
VQRYYEVKRLRRNWAIDRRVMCGDAFEDSNFSFDSKLIGKISHPTGSKKDSSVTGTTVYAQNIDF